MRRQFWIWATLVACQRERAGVDAPDTVDTPEPGDTDLPADPIPTVDHNIADEVGDCVGRQRTPPAWPNQLDEGEELTRLTLDDPDAVCNDGTPAVLYVRAASDPALADTWSIHLQGGGGCQGWLSCVERWCGLSYYDMSKMSSANLPQKINGLGIYDADPVNALAGANQVFFYYCSSDSWAGKGNATYAAPAEVPELPFELPALPTYTLARRGHAIFEAGIDALFAGAVADDGTTLRSLSGATSVVFSGTSAGSSGAILHADRLRSRLPATTRMAAIFDANIPPAIDATPPDVAASMTATYADGAAQEAATLDRPNYVEPSCAALVYPGAPAWQCNDLTYVMLNHVTTPYFTRHDLTDISERAEIASITEDDHEAAVVTTLTRIHNLRDTAIEADQIARAPGVYGPNCAQHVALESTRWWVQSELDDDAGHGWTYQAAFLAWSQGDDVALIDEPVAGDGTGPRSTCATNDAGR